MRKLTTILISATFAMMAAIPTAGAAAPTTTRNDAHYEIWCTTSSGEVYLAKRVDAHAIQPEKDPGGKDTATERFNANNPYGERCAEGDLVTP